MFKIAFLVGVIAVAGCGKKDEGGGGGGGAAKSVKLPKLGLTIDVGGETRVDDAIMGEGNMINGSSVGAMQVEIPKEAQTIEQAKEDASMYTPKNLKEEKLADGWALTFDNKGSMGANYFVTVQRTIDGKNYKCWVTTGDAKQAANVLTACKTLKKG
jgi:hypothetical protein